jgi:hypothetical protein
LDRAAGALPGEWFLDTRTGRLTYWALQGEDMLRAEAIAPVLTQLVRIAGDAAGGKPVAFLRFRGLGFEHADWTLPAEGYADMQSAYDIPAAFDVVGAHDITIENCRLQHLGAAHRLRPGVGEPRHRQRSLRRGARGIKISSR